jgi:hypothetical protein
MTATKKNRLPKVAQARDTFGGGALAPQVKREAVIEGLAAIRRESANRRDRYRGGLTAERDSAKALRRKARWARRAKIASGRGRQIDLVAILRRNRPDGSPLWALVDPTRPIDASNGHVDDTQAGSRIRFADGHEGYVGNNRVSYRLIETGLQRKKDFQPVGVPALPPRIREIVTDPRVRSKATFVGVLYQPESWVEVDPDPAVIVEWKDLPGKYFALAIWGGDRAQIEEYLS